MMSLPSRPMRPSRVTSGVRLVKRTVYLSIASTFSSAGKLRLATAGTSGGSFLPSTESRTSTDVNSVLVLVMSYSGPNMRSRLKVKTTSSAVISSPLWNFTPLRSASSTVRSSRRFQLSARPGTGSSWPIRFCMISVSKRKEKVREPTLDCSRKGSSEALLEICWTAMVMLGRRSAWPMATRGRAALAAARPEAAIRRRRRRNMMRTPLERAAR